MKQFLKDLWAFMRVRKKVWLLPLVMVILIFAALFLLLEGSIAVPYIYTLF